MLPPAMNPRAQDLNNYVNRRFHESFCRMFVSLETRGKKLLEVGCARSVWLPYFAKEFGFRVSGIDYSEIGCQQAIEVLHREGVQGEVVCTDLWALPPSLVGQFDVLISCGVVEHFQDTAFWIMETLFPILKPNRWTSPYIYVLSRKS